MPNRSLDWVVPSIQDKQREFAGQLFVGVRLLHVATGEVATLVEQKTDHWGFIKVRVSYPDSERDAFELMPWGRAWHSVDEFVIAGGANQWLVNF